MIKAKSKKTNKILKHYQVYSFVVRRNVKLNEPQFWEDTLTPDKLVMHAHYILKAHITSITDLKTERKEAYQ